MHFELTNQLTYVSELEPGAYEALVKLLTYDGQDKFIMDWKTRKYKFNHNFTRHCLLENMAFPTGLANREVRAELRQQGFTVTVSDLRKKPAPPDISLLPETLQLRPYQLEAVHAGIKAGRGIFDLPTGSGKSRLAAALISVFPVNWLFIAPTAQLVDQVAQTLRSIGVEPSILGDRRYKPGPITLSTSKMLHTRRDTPEVRKLLNSVQGVIADECHKVGGDMYYSALMDCNAYYRFGLSGTPDKRSDDKNLKVVGALGSPIYEKRIAELTDEGYLARANIIMHRFAQTYKAANPSEGMRVGVTRSKPRNDLLVKIAQTIPRPGLVFVREEAHGKLLTKRLKDVGLKVDFIWGKVPVNVRKSTVTRLESGELDLIVCSVVFQEGIDIPSLRGGLVTPGGRSVVANCQRLGRFTRLDNDKTGFELHDILDECAGDPDDAENPCGNRFLASQARARLATYKDEGHSVTVV